MPAYYNSKPSIVDNPTTRTAAEKLNIIIIGAGISGFSASISCALSGHNVTILESTKELGEIGNGLQLTPNSTRILTSLSVLPKIRGICEPKTYTVHSYTGRVLAHDPSFAESMRAKFGAPFADVHRVDLQQAFITRAREVGVNVILEARVVALELGEQVGDKAVAVTEKGDRYSADLLVGADGLWSTTRSLLLGHEDKPQPTGDLAYRMTLRIHELWDEDLRKMVQEPGLRFWIGPNAHVAAYSVRGGSIFNFGLLVPDDLPEGVARMRGSLEQMGGLMEGWDPVIKRLVSHVKTVDKWKLMHRPALPTWLSPNSNLVLIGDAAHPMLPYLAQGANSSIEDGAALGLLLQPKYLTNTSRLPDLLRVFQDIRKERGERIAGESFKQRRDFHLENGVEQQKRDEVFEKWLGREVVEGEELGVEGFPSRWSCPRVTGWIYGYDVERAVEDAMEGKQNGEKEEELLYVM